MTEQSDIESIEGLRREVRRLNEHRFVRIYNSVWRMIGFQFMRGLAFGLGSVMGATVLVSIFVYFLSQLEIIPYIGDYMTRILNQIEAERMTGE